MGRVKKANFSKDKFLSPEEYDSLIKSFQKFIEKDTRNCLLLWTLLESGARCQELLNARKADLDPVTKEIFIRGLKGSRDRSVPLTAELFDRLWTFVEPMNRQDLLFPIKYNRAREIWVFYRPVEKKIHCLRHTCAIRTFEVSKDPKVVQTVLGHTTLIPTQIYMDFFYSQNTLREKMGRNT